MKNLILLLEANNNEQALIVVAYIIGIIIMIFITRAIFSIGTIVRNLKAQTKLLGLMAEKSGVDAELINAELLDADILNLPKKIIKEEKK